MNQIGERLLYSILTSSKDPAKKRNLTAKERAGARIDMQNDFPDDPLYGKMPYTGSTRATADSTEVYGLNGLNDIRKSQQPEEIKPGQAYDDSTKSILDRLASGADLPGDKDRLKYLSGLKRKEDGPPTKLDLLEEENKSIEATIKNKQLKGQKLTKTEQAYIDGKSGGSKSSKGRSIDKAREEVLRDRNAHVNARESSIRREGTGKKQKEFFKDEDGYNLNDKAVTTKSDTLRMIDTAKEIGYKIFDGAEGSFLSDFNKFNKQANEYRARVQKYGNRAADQWLAVESGGEYNAEELAYLIQRMTGK